MTRITDRIDETAFIDQFQGEDAAIDINNLTEKNRAALGDVGLNQQKLAEIDANKDGKIKGEELKGVFNHLDKFDSFGLGSDGYAETVKYTDTRSQITPNWIANEALKSEVEHNLARARTREKSVAFQIVGTFEGGEPDKLQTRDKGIISYGSHQATLSSGSLEQVLKRYIELTPDSPTAIKLQDFMQRVKRKDPSLRKNSEFLGLLKEAAKEPQMQRAQDEIFTKKYYDPAVKKAQELGLKSPMAKTLLFDNHIQGGMNKVVENTLKRFEGKNYTEKEFLQAFVDERKKLLLKNSENNFRKAEELRGKAAELRAAGNEAGAKNLEAEAQSEEANGRFLKISANDSRGPALEKLVESENWDLKGEFKLKKKNIYGGE